MIFAERLLFLTNIEIFNSLNTINCEGLGDEDKTWRYLSDKIVSGTWKKFLIIIEETMEYCHLPEWN